MAKVKGKGTVIQHTISMSLTAIAQVKSIEISGTASQTWDSTALDTAVWKTKDQTGFSEPGEVSAELWFDPALAGHQFITDLIAAPADNAMKIIYADTGLTQQSFTVAGAEFGVTVELDDGLSAEVTYTIDGDPGFPT